MTADELKALPRFRLESFAHPILLHTMYVRSLTSDERDDWEVSQYLINGENVELNRRQLRSRLVVRSLCDQTGARVFADTDVATVGGMDSGIVDPMYDAAKRVNGLDKKDEEDLAKNSAAAPAVSSS